MMLREYFRRWHNLLRGLAGFIYDFQRFVHYTATGGIRTTGQRSFKAVKTYHCLEKSLSFRMRKPESGWDDALRLSRLFSRSVLGTQPLDYQEEVAIKVLFDFVANSASAEGKSDEVRAFLDRQLAPRSDVPGGYSEISSLDINQGHLSDPEKFFHSRRSVRDYSDKPVNPALIERAVGLAMASPSVCNRQAWHVYHLDERTIIDGALKFQNGNRGFGHEVPCLLVITADLEAFDNGAERYQHWIDGGMFAMALVLALHSLGVASCCLNWSKGPRHDIAFRKYLPIKPSHSVIMMLAVGYPKPDLKVCTSARRPMATVLTSMSEADRKVLLSASE